MESRKQEQSHGQPRRGDKKSQGESHLLVACNFLIECCCILAFRNVIFGIQFLDMSLQWLVDRRDYEFHGI